jgi:hypothetical protein
MKRTQIAHVKANQTAEFRRIQKEKTLQYLAKAIGRKVATITVVTESLVTVSPAIENLAIGNLVPDPHQVKTAAFYIKKDQKTKSSELTTNLDTK